MAALNSTQRQTPLARAGLIALCLSTFLCFSLPFVFQPRLFLTDRGIPPDGMIPDGGRELTGRVFQYEDVLGRTWYRLMNVAAEDSDPHFRLDASAYPDGCCITWYSTDANALSISSPDAGLRRGLGRGLVGSQYPRILKREMISPSTLRKGIHLGLVDPTQNSVFARIAPRRVEKDAWHEDAGFSGRNSRWILFACGLSILTWGGLCVGYVQTGKFRYAATACCLAFLLGAAVFDRPYSGFAGQIDAGDDSYYLAYAQNLLVHGTFFKEPTAIAFGARRVTRNHGLPGTGLFLAPAVVVQALVRGEPVRRPIDLHGLRAMRLLSAGYSLAAMILLGASFHLVRPSAWNVAFPSFLLWGTSLSKWTFQRCLFTHSVEMAFLCALLFVLAWIWRKPVYPVWKGMLLGSCLGCAFLVRGEYLLAIPLVPFLLAPAVREQRRFFLKTCAGYGVAVAAAASLYAGWVRRISTGYGDVRSSQSQFFSAASSVAEMGARLWAQMLELFRDYWASGLVLFGALLAFAVGSVWLVRHRSALRQWPLDWFGLAALALALFLSNACFHTPLGMEWQHRYSLKIYPLAFWVLWLAVVGRTFRGQRAANVGLALIVAASLCRQLRAFGESMWMKDAGWFAWTDEQLVLEGMRSPYGLYVLAGTALLACGVAALLADGIRRERVAVQAGRFMLLVFPFLAAWAADRLGERPDRAGMNFQYYDDPHLGKAAGADVRMALDAWHGRRRPHRAVDPEAYSLAGTGWLFAPTSAEYRFYAESKDGLRLYVDGEIAVDNWQNRTWKNSGRHAARHLEKGFHALRLEHCKCSGEGGFRVRWCGGGIAPNTVLAEPYLQRENGGRGPAE